MSDQVIQFPTQDTLDKTGQDVLVRLQRAAGLAEHQLQQAFDAAHQSSMQLRVANDRVARLEYDLDHYKQRALRAEEWLQRIAHEIDQTFPSRNAERPDTAPRRNLR